MESQVINKLDAGVEKSISYFNDELKKLRTGRAHPSMLDGITAEAYGQQMPLIQLATITTPEPQLIQVKPFDANNLQAIADSIRNNQTLGFNPVDDGHIIRVPVPPLTEERRHQIAKQLKEKVEECMISVRGVRQTSMKEIEQAKKDKDISEDEFKRLEKQINEAVAEAKDKVETTAKNKETEIMTI